MKSRPILFSAPMVRALLDGSKTQTRRVVKIERIDSHPQMPNVQIATMQSNGSQYWMNCQKDHPHHIANACPYGKPGDQLWVKETTVKVEDHGYVGPVYAESEEGRAVIEYGLSPSPDDMTEVEPEDIKLRPSLFMTKAMSRITLEITGVRVERLGDISRKDAEAEGVGLRRVSENDHRWIDYADKDGGRTFGDPRQSFWSLWQSINGPGSFGANPWVWVVEFKRVAQ